MHATRCISITVIKLFLITEPGHTLSTAGKSSRTMKLLTRTSCVDARVIKKTTHTHERIIFNFRRVEVLLSVSNKRRHNFTHEYFINIYILMSLINSITNSRLNILCFTLLLFESHADLYWVGINLGAIDLEMEKYACV